MRRREFIVGVAGAAAWPLAARAQQPALPVVGYLSTSPDTEVNRVFAGAFRQGLREQGYVEGRNVEILYRWAENRYDRLPALAADLVHRRVAAIFAPTSTPAALAAKAATATIPVVFTIGTDPVELGLVASLNRPGSNVTGVTFRTTEITAKRFELVHEIVPAARSIGFLVNPTNHGVTSDLREAETAARILGIGLVILNASTPSEIEAAFATIIAQRVSALVIEGDQFFFDQIDQLVPLTAKHALPAIHAQRDFADAGGLMSYGGSTPDAVRIAGTYVGRILKGEKPADLPVQQSTRIDMVLNLKTAKAIGVTIPERFLQVYADEVIE